MLTGNIFITGGAGFLGRGILKRAHDGNWPCQFTVFSRDEVKHAKLKTMFPQVKTIRGDVSGDIDRLITAMIGHDIVIHAAATKIVPQAEYNVVETIQDNTIGSYNVAYAACQSGISKVLGISTDKACNPINVYGMSKALLERIFIEAQGWGYDTDFHLVRYGNVMDSTASVLTLWQQQINDVQELMMTNPEMTRFWLTINQAVDLVLFALQTIPGTILIPLLKSLSIGEMADYVYPDAQREIIGMRPGEKIHEQLIAPNEGSFIRVINGGELVSLYPATWGLVEKSTSSDYWPSYDSKMADRLTKDEFLAMVKE